MITSAIALIQRSYRRWTEAQDIPSVLAASDLKSWISATIGAALVVAIATLIPGTHEYTHLDVEEAVLGFLPALLLGLTWNLVRGRRKEMRSTDWIFFMLGIPALQFWAAGLIAWSQMPGAAVFACILLFTAGFHGYLHRVTLTEPFLAIGTFVACLAAAAFDHDPAHRSLFSVVTPATVTVEVLAGTIAMRAIQNQAEAERLRAAVHAQMLEQREHEVRRLSQTLVEVLGANHDVNNSVTSAHLAAEGLSELCLAESPEPAELREAVTDLTASLSHIKSIVEHVRSTRVPSPALSETVDIESVLHESLQTVAPRFPSVTVKLTSTESSGLRAWVAGGAISLRRVLDNLLLNACEGNGLQQASAIEVSVQRAPSGAGVVIEVADDGPGFPQQLLANPIAGFATSKKNGTGLGLYTSERLVRASGGVLERSNRASGGACVRVTLPLEH